MNDEEFYERLHQVSAALAREGAETLLRPDELDRCRLVLRELASEPGTAADRERLAALQAAYVQVSRLASLAPAED